MASLTFSLLGAINKDDDFFNRLGFYLFLISLLICLTYWAAAFKDPTSEYLNSLSLNNKLEDIGDYLERVEKTPNFIGVCVEASHMRRGGKHGSRRKVVTWTGTFPFEHCKVEDLTSISRESVINLANPNRRGGIRPYLEFDSIID